MLWEEFEMLAYKFETEISESGLLKIPEEILDKVKHRSVEVVILQDESVDQEGENDFRALMGKYKGCLSTADEFSMNKSLEKEKDM
jgi:hypothetical protein